MRSCTCEHIRTTVQYTACIYRVRDIHMTSPWPCCNRKVIQYSHRLRGQQLLECLQRIFQKKKKKKRERKRMKEWRRYNVKSDRSDNLPKNLMEAVSKLVFIRCKDFASLNNSLFPILPFFFFFFSDARLFGTWSSCWNACPFLWITLHCYVTYKVPHYANNSMHARVCIDCNFSSCASFPPPMQN